MSVNSGALHQWGISTVRQPYMGPLAMFFSQQIGTLKLHTCADDLLSCSHDFASHCAQLEELFSTLLQSGLRISPGKASIATDSCTFLSHRISAEGILPTDNHLKLIQSLAPLPIINR